MSFLLKDMIVLFGEVLKMIEIYFDNIKLLFYLESSNSLDI